MDGYNKVELIQLFILIDTKQDFSFFITFNLQSCLNSYHPNIILFCKILRYKFRYKKIPKQIHVKTRIL